MKVTLQLTIAALCILNSGCTLSHNLLRTSIVQPILYSDCLDTMLERRRFRKLAQGELECARVRARAESDRYSCPPFSVDHERGFVAGFIDYLVYGGAGNPPPLPPRRYWWSGSGNDGDGHAIQDWFNGFQHGATVAQASGYRNSVTVPVPDELFNDTTPVYPSQYFETKLAEPVEAIAGEPDVPAETVPPPTLPAPPPEVRELPAPRELPAATPEPPPAADANDLFDGELPGGDAQLDESRLHGSAVQDSTPSSVTTESSSVTPVTGNEAESAPMLDSPTGDSAPTFDLITLSFERLINKPSNVAVSLRPFDTPDIVLRPSLIDGIDQLVMDHALLDQSNQSLLAPNNAPNRKVDPHSEEDKSSSVEKPVGESEPAVGEKQSAISAKPAAVKHGRSERAWRYSLATTLGQPRWPIIVGAVLLLLRAIVVSLRKERPGHPTNPQEVKTHTGPSAAGKANPKSLTKQRPNTTRSGQSAPTKGPVPARGMLGLLMILTCCLSTGCSALTNPVLNGIPVRKLPNELLALPHRENLQTIPLSMLRQKQPTDYTLGAGDVMGVYIAGVFPPTLGDQQQLTPPPVYFPSQIDPLGAGLPPSLGYPITIRNDGTLALPLVEPILLEGLTVEEANERVRSAYVDKGILQPGRESVLLTLMQPRQIRILVFRQEVGGFAAGGRGDISSNNLKQGTGHIVDLRAYENDIVHALANTGGLPGLDAFDGIFIFRGAQSNLELTQRLQSLPSDDEISELAEFGVETDYIPTRWPAGEPLPFKPEDAILHEGDVVLLEARVQDLFYTAGLLPAGERVIPRDYDLDVVEAVVQVSGTLVNGAFGGNNFNGLLIQKGLGNPNPSALTVIRRAPNGGQVPIRVDLNRALVDPRERILVRPGDILILQETKHEAMARYFNDILNFNVFLQAFQRGSASGAAAVTQLPQ